jgi:hypothetical protein
VTPAKLIRYWFEFESTPSRFATWVGVTAWTLDDARLLVSKEVFGGKELPPLNVLIEDVDVSTLDAGHVLPNMNPPNERGVWYPKGTLS